MKFKNEEILLIGDTQHDADVAQEMGINCILVSIGHQTVNKLLQTGVKVIESISEQTSYLNLKKSS